MEKIWIIITAIGIFNTLNLAHYLGMIGYVKKTFGEKWLNAWGNKVWFWQSSIFLASLEPF